MSKHRIAWIDVLKFFGIFAIYLGHFKQNAGWSYPFVFTYHVALFFFAAGCTESMSREKKALAYIKLKTKTLLIPWFVFAILSIAFMVILKDYSLGGVKDSLILTLKGTIRNTFVAYSLWFLTCLYIVSILFYFIKKLKYKSVILFVSLLLFIIAQKIQQASLIFNIDEALYYIVYYAIGYCSFGAINKLLQFEDSKSKIIFYISGLISLAYTFLLFFQRDALSFMSTVPFLNIFKQIITPLIVIWFFICLSFVCRNVKLFNSIGQNTLYLCGSEYIIKELLFQLVALLSLRITLETPLAAYIYAFISLCTAYKILVPLEKRLLHKITAFNLTA